VLLDAKELFTLRHTVYCIYTVSHNYKTPYSQKAKLCYYAVFRHKHSHDGARDNAVCIYPHYLLPLLRSHILTAWDELDHQRVIDTTVTQWRTRLRVC